MAGYNRKSPNPFVDAAIIEASDFNDEFGNLDIAFGTSGHTHNGTDGNGPQIATAGIEDDAVTGDKIDSGTTITAASFVGPLTGNVTGNLDAASATIDSLTITSGTAVTSIDTDLTSVSASDDTLASAKAIKTYIDAQVDTADQLSELTDVTITGTPADNEVLAYDSTSSEWINQTATEAGLQPNDAGLTSIAGLTTSANKMIYATASDTYATTDLTAAGRAILDDADASAQRTTLGLAIGTDVQAYDAGLNSIAGLTTAADKMIYTTASDTYAVTSLTSAGRAILDDADASAQRTTLGVAIGTDVQAYDAGLNSIAGLTTAADKMIYTTASDTYAVTSLSSFGRTLIDDADASAARTTLGLGTAATTASTAYATSAQGTKADNALPKAGGTMTGNITFNSTQTFDGRDLSADGAKLDNIEANATADQTASEILTAIKTVDGAGSGLDADTLDGNHASSFLTGNQTITLSGDATGSGTTAITVALAANTVGVSELNLTDGTSGQFLKTDGAGTISFADAPSQGTTFSTIDINGGAVDGVTIGTNSVVTDLRVDNLKLDGNTLSSTNSNGDITLDPNGTGNIALEAITKVTGTEPSTRYDTTGDGSVTIADYQPYYDFTISHGGGGSSLEGGMSLDVPWSGDSSATNDNCRFGISIIQGNTDDAGSVVVSNTPVGHGDTVSFGNIQHDSDGDAILINGICIAGKRVEIGSRETGGGADVQGSLTKGSGSFKIDHPLSSKESTHYLVHSFVEAPQADNIYRGKVDLVNGSASVNIDTVAGMSEGTFVALNREVQCFTSNESDWDAVKGSVSGNILTISCQNTSSTATISWLVIGERKDQHMYDTGWTDENGKVIVEPTKDS